MTFGELTELVCAYLMVIVVGLLLGLGFGTLLKWMFL